MTATPAPGAAPWAPRVDHGAEVFRLCLEAREFVLGKHLIDTRATIGEARRRLDMARAIRSHAAIAAKLGAPEIAGRVEQAIAAGTSAADFGRAIVDAVADRQAATEIRSSHQAGVGPDASSAWRASVERTNEQ